MSNSSSSDVIEAQNLYFKFDDHAIFEDLNFRWDARRIALLGRNGSGKSTLARLIAGLLKPVRGEILVNGQNLYENRKAALDEIGIVFQSPDEQIIFPTVIDELKFGFSQMGDKAAEKRALEILRHYGREDWKDRLVSTLSQGQRHFLALISILEMRPSVLVLDEAFTGLDIPTTMRLQAVLDEYEGMIVHVTHQVELIADYDWAVWVDNRRIVQAGSPSEVASAYEAEMKKWGASDAHTGF